ncbi:MAG TPA: hypothetical protein VK696_02410 [Steroidobacteraceae bacterium]|jgi:hypothetical protein|nr:hypothetical protein [Steroidobacteraceae bacterium]
MFKRARVSLLAVLALGVAGAAFADTDATRDQIYQAAQAGHLAEAQKMIDQVLLDHPQSASAHFVAAELDARIGDFAGARQQLATAKQLDPAEHFTNARALSELERQLTGIRGGVPGGAVQPFAPAVAHRSTVPWGLIIILAIGAFVLFSIFRGRAQRAAYSQTYGPGGPGLIAPGNPGAPPGYGYGPGYPPPGGSGLMGNLASGLAIGAGVAAGEELVRHVIDGHSTGNVPPDSNFNDPPPNQDMGGNDFGGSPDNSSWGDNSGGGDSGGWGGDSGGGGGGDWT